MGFVFLPGIEDVVNETDPKKQSEMIVNTLGILLKELKELNGYLSGTNIRAKSIQAEKLTVDKLSAITADMGKITAGEMYSPYIATQEAAFPRVELNSTGNLFQALKDVQHTLAVLTLIGLDVPALRFNDSALGKTAYIYLDSYSSELAIISNAAGIQLSANGGNLKLNGTNVLINGANINNKADRTNVTKTVYVSATSGGVANIPLTITNGVVTS